MRRFLRRPNRVPGRPSGRVPDPKFRVPGPVSWPYRAIPGPIGPFLAIWARKPRFRAIPGHMARNGQETGFPGHMARKPRNSGFLAIWPGIPEFLEFLGILGFLGT